MKTVTDLVCLSDQAKILYHRVVAYNFKQPYHGTSERLSSFQHRVFLRWQRRKLALENYLSSFEVQHKARLIHQARDTWTRLDNQYDLLFACQHDPFELGYLACVCSRAYDRYIRRVDEFSFLYPGVDFFAIETQQIASAVELEAFPEQPTIEEKDAFFDREKSALDRFNEQRLTNSGDCARLPAGAPVLSESLPAREPGIIEPKGDSEEQGGTQECQRDYFFVNDFCQCDACRPRHDYLAGIFFARAWQAGTV